MRVLVSGRGKGGSWVIRGEQLGAAIGATVDPAPKSLKGFDVAVLVKRPRPDIVQELRKAKIPIVWDVVDSWPQPVGNDWDRNACIDWLNREVEWIRPAKLVVATDVMAKDCGHLAMPVLVLPHHARRLEENQLRETVKYVGYQGGDYLGPWQDIICGQCEKRGWAFVCDYTKTAERNLQDFDIVVALRGQTGYAAQHWKSNVKLANAQGAGVPSVVSRATAYVETAGARQYFADDEAGLSEAFDVLTSLERRQEQVNKYRPPKLRHIAERYRDWLWRG